MRNHSQNEFRNQTQRGNTQEGGRRAPRWDVLPAGFDQNEYRQIRHNQDQQYQNLIQNNPTYALTGQGAAARAVGAVPAPRAEQGEGARAQPRRIEVRQRGDGDVVVEPERPMIIINPGEDDHLQPVQLNHNNLTEMRRILMGVTMDAQADGERIQCTDWTRTRGYITVQVQPGPEASGPRSWSARESGDNLIRLHHHRQLLLPSGTVIIPSAMWNTDMPRIAEFTARFPMTIGEERARQIIESPVFGMGVANSFPQAAIRELRFVAIKRFEDGSGDTMIRFQGGSNVARELQRRRGRVTLGCTTTTIQYNRAEITPETIITLNLQV